MRRLCFVLFLLAACRAAEPSEGVQVVLPMDGQYGTSSRFLFTTPVYALENPNDKTLGTFYDGSGRAAFGFTSNVGVSEWVTEHLIRALRADVINAHRVAAFPSKGVVLSGKIIECSVEGSSKESSRISCKLWIRFILYKDGQFCRKLEYSESRSFAYLSEATEQVLTSLLRDILRQAVPAMVRMLMEHG